MKIGATCRACLLASACGHDLTRLEPSLDKAAAWLPDGVPAACVTCVTTACAEQARACLDHRGCHAAFGQCQPANPSCGLGSRLNRDLAVCIQGACADRCYPIEERLSCLADYSLPQPPSGRSIETSASPILSSVIAVSTLMSGLGRNVSAADLTACWSRGVKALSLCCTRLPSWPATLSGMLIGFCVMK